MTRILVLLLALCAGPASSQADVAQVQLLPGWRMENGRHMAGIRIDLAPGWKTYWRAPGDAGIPPSFDWGGSTNMAGVTIHWPAPVVFHQAGMRSVGYAGGVVLPVEIRPADPSAPVTLDLSLDFGVCRDVCIPVHARTAAGLDPAADRPDARIRSALGALPLSAAEAGAGPAACRLTPTPGGARLDVTVPLPPMGEPEDIVIEPADPGAWVSEPSVTRSGNTLTASADLSPPRGAPLALDRARLRTTIIGPRGTVEIVGCR